MKLVHVELQDHRPHEAQHVLETGRFENAAEVVQVAVVEFITRRRFEQTEQQYPFP